MMRDARHGSPVLSRLAVSALVFTVACQKETPPTVQKEPAIAASSQPELKARLVFKEAPKGDVAELVKAERELAEKRGQKLVVYVGATWCEPCKVFHQAAISGDLDQELPPATFIEFDLDRDQDRLEKAGYKSKYIPLFALSGPDGRMTKSIAGSIKGPGAAGEIAPRLRQLVEDK